MCVIAMTSAIVAGNAQVDVGIGYNLFRPVSEMSTTVPSIHVLNLYGFYTIPQLPVLVGFDFGVGAHGTEMSNLDFVFDDGASVPARMTVNNSVLQMGLALRYEFMRSAAVRPYVSARGGWMSFFTRLTIEDRLRADPEFDARLYNETLVSDFKWVYSFGGGLRYDLGNAFKILEDEHYFIDIGIHWMDGGTVDHMSTRADKQENGTPELFVRPDDNLVDLPWYTGRIFRTRMQAMEYRFKLVYRF